MRQRDTYTKLINTTRWRLLRNSVLRKSPLCADCLSEGINRCATEVHHVVPVESAVGEYAMRALCYDEKNLVALCHECHVLRHMQMRSHSKENVKANNKRAVDGFIKRFFE